jgi:decaprenylphospho-beta-D-ribofuranose 2-oxidase
MAAVVDVGPTEARDEIRRAGARGVLARGLGRSYGDSAQNGGGVLLRLPAHDLIDVDPTAGTARVGAGVSLDDLLRAIVPRGFFVPVTPGTRFVTIGGAVASDIHGKNHHVDGSFANHVVSLRLLLADGSTAEVNRSEHAALFWATVGGMGLTGIILEATIGLLRVGSSRIVVDTDRAVDLDHALALMQDGDDQYRYSVAWIDLLARGRSLGRSVLTRGDHAPLAALEGGAARDPLHYDPSVRLSVPPFVPSVLNHVTVAAFNEFWFRRAPRRRRNEVQSIPRFFHPLDAVGKWNRLYGRHGFVQYQFVIPFGEEQALRSVIERIAGSGAASFLAVLKRFGPSNDAPLSFPLPGWTLALDIGAAFRHVGDLLHDLDATVLDAGGRHYLAKDAHTTPEAIRRGYPRLEEWQNVRDKADPAGLWASDQARRLRLIG